MDEVRLGSTLASATAMTDQTSTHGPKVARHAVLWMLAATLGYAVLPLIIWFGVRDMSPFTFVAFWYVVSVACQALLRQGQVQFRERRDQQLRGQPNGRSETQPQTTERRDRSRFVIFDDLRKVKLRYLLIWDLYTWVTVAGYVSIFVCDVSVDIGVVYKDCDRVF